MRALILIADQDSTRLEELERCVRAVGHNVISCSTSEELFHRARKERPAACILAQDLLPRGPLDPDRERMAGLPSRPAILFARDPSELTDVSATRAWIDAELDNRALRLQREGELRQEPEDRAYLEGDSPAIRRLRQGIERVASTETPVLLTGEAGTGKGIGAREIHRRSHRRRVFTQIRCDGGDRAALERLFGGGPASFPGALDGITGGSVYLSRIDLAGPGLQRQLLGVLERRSWEPPGGSPRPADVRWIASSEGDLQEAADRGRFSADLLYRLNVLSLRTPALREREADLPHLAESILQRLARTGGPRVQLEPRAVEELTAYAWPGNRPELSAAILHAAYAAEGGSIRSVVASPGRNDSAPNEDAFQGARNLKDVEEALIRRVLAEVSGNRSQAARVLGVNRTTLYNKLRAYGIAAPGSKLSF